MVWNKLPFLITLIASILPWMAAFFDLKWITYIPLSLSLLTYFIYKTRKQSKILSISYGFMIIFFVIMISVSWQLSHSIGIGSGGSIIIVVLTFIYYNLFSSAQFGIPSRYLIKQIHIIYGIHIVFILAELIFRLAGGTEIIVSLVGNATEVARYKMYNKAMFLNYIGFENMTGLGGLLLGSQSASQVALFAMFVFAPFYRTNIFYKFSNIATIWFFLSLVAFLISITMMASIIFSIFVALFFFYLPNSKYKNIKYQLLFITMLIIFFMPISRILLFNISNERDFLIYFSAFYTSWDNFIHLDPINLFFGLGKNASSLMTSIPGLEGERADFGLGMLLNQSGVLLIGSLVLILIKIFFLVQHSITRMMKFSLHQNPWVWLATVNSLIALGWGLSLIHYTPAVELGGRELFAFHLAICLLSVKNMKRNCVLIISSLDGK